MYSSSSCVWQSEFEYCTKAMQRDEIHFVRIKQLESVRHVSRRLVSISEEIADTAKDPLIWKHCLPFGVQHLGSFVVKTFPQHLRAKCISLCSATNWIWDFLLSFFSNKITSQYNSSIMLIFGSVLVFFSFFSSSSAFPN